MKDTGGPAFPSTHPHGREEGMSLRDWFAGMAMQAHLPPPPGSHLTTAQFAYLIADAMLKERSKE
jgi:hypothetical protein